MVEYLRKFTLLPREQIEVAAVEHGRNPGARTAQKALAREVTALVHGPSACDDAIRASEIMFGGGLEGVTEAVFQDVVGEVPTKDFEKSRLAGNGASAIDLLVHAGLCPSKGQARKDIESGGISINSVRVTDFAKSIGTSDLLFGQYLLLRKGKRTYAVLKVVG